MTQEDRQALRLFYQTVAKNSFPQDAFSLYWALQGGKDGRLEWVRQHTDRLKLTPEIIAVLTTMDDLSKADLALLAAVQVTPMVAPKVQKTVDSIWAWRGWPWNWF